MNPNSRSFDDIGSDVRSSVDLLGAEIGECLTRMVLPTWDEPAYSHHFARTLYGYVMNTTSFIDLLSLYEFGPQQQTERMVKLVHSRFGATPRASSIFIQMWRHTLMHGASPRLLPEDPHSQADASISWLLHWGEPWLPRSMNMTLSQNGSISVLNLGLVEFVQDLRVATDALFTELGRSQASRDAVESLDKTISRSPNSGAPKSPRR